MIQKRYLFYLGWGIVFVMSAFFTVPEVSAARTPTVGRVLEDNINVRTDSTVTAQEVGTLQRNDEVEIIGEKYGWFKIRLPQDFTCYVSLEHVKRVGRDKVEVLVFALNLRLYASLESPIIGKVREGTILTLLGTKGEWAKVVAYPYAWGWVHKRFIDEIREARDEHPEEAVDSQAPQQRSQGPNKSSWRTWLNPQQDSASKPLPQEERVPPARIDVIEAEQTIEVPQTQEVIPSVVVEEKEQTVTLLPAQEEPVPSVSVIEKNQVIPIQLQEKPQAPAPYVQVIEEEIVQVVPEKKIAAKPLPEKKMDIIDKVVDLSEHIKGQPHTKEITRVSPVIKVVEQETGIDFFTSGNIDSSTVYGKLRNLDRTLGGCQANFLGVGPSGQVLLNINNEKFNPKSFLDKDVKIQGEVKDDGCLYIDVHAMSLL
ncbi:MAG: SH3 domain-containing protein [Candidatus Omnitrophica bacterium]|nr:SH3 domain-containing protein [Candidatus Omnitrophota bacterium]